MKALTRTLALLGCAAALGAALAACDQELRDSGERKEISGLQLDKLDVSGAKKAFAKGAEFKLGNVVAVYTTGDKKKLTESEVTVKGFDSSEVKENVTVTITHTSGGVSKSADYKVNILAELKVPEAVYYAALDGTDEGDKVQIVGRGQYVDDETFGTVFKNVVDKGDGGRVNYLRLFDVFDGIGGENADGFTIGFWVRNHGDVSGESAKEWTEYYASPLFTAQSAHSTIGDAWPFFAFEMRLDFGFNWGAWYNPENTTNDTKWVANNTDWHYAAISVSRTDGITIYIDGQKSGMAIAADEVTGYNPESKGEYLGALITDIPDADFSLCALGGSQVCLKDWPDKDVPLSFAQFSVWDEALTQEQIEEVILR